MLRKLQRRSTSRGWLCAIGLLSANLLGTVESGCASKKPRVEAPSPPTYGGEQAALFSDLFRPELFGIDQASPPEKDTLLADRARSADFVGPVRVTTVTRETRGVNRNYTVVVEATGAPVRGTPRADALALTVYDGSPAFAWLEGIGDKWVGTRLLLVLRYYADGPHFFGTVDTPAVRAALPNEPPARAQP
jgi:hypothetical protein